MRSTKRVLISNGFWAGALWIGLGLAGCDKKESEAAKAEPPKSADATKAEPPAGGDTGHAGDASAHGGKPPFAHPPMAMQPKQPGPPRDVSPSGETQELSVGEIKLPVPKEWEQGQPTSPMRKAEYVLPGPGGDAELVVFRFAGGAGGIEANVERWKGQFQPPEGKTIDDMTKVKNLQAGDLKITLVDVSGHYVAAVMPGTDAKHDAAGYRMLAAIVEGSGDPFFFKATGPAATMELWAAPFETALGKLAKAG